MAYLAGEIAEVLSVLGVGGGVRPDVLVAVLALDDVGIIIPAGGKRSRAVEFLTVAIGTEHTFLSPVDIGGDTLIFPEVFSTYTGAVAGQASISDGSHFLGWASATAGWVCASACMFGVLKGRLKKGGVVK